MTPLRRLAACAVLVLTPLAAAQPGTPDASFGEDGYVSTASFGPFHLTVQSDGALVLGGIDAATGRAALHRLLADGTPDIGFGTAGTARLPLNEAVVIDAVVQPGGFLMVAGVRAQGDEVSFAPYVARLTPAGALDAAFGDGGIRFLDGGSTFGLSVALALAPDGAALVAWSAADYVGAIAAQRFRADGSLDMGYGVDGTAFAVSPEFVVPDVASAIADGAGRLYVSGGTSSETGAYAVFATRLLADGTLDAAYGTDGVATASATGFSVGQAAALGPDGLVVAGYESFNEANPGGSGSAYLAVRFTDDGTPDPAFGTDGTAFFRGPSGDGAAFAVALDADGRIVLGGGDGEIADGPDAVLLRLLPDGTLDGAFGTGGFSTLAGQGDLYSLAPAADGAFLATGGSDEAGFVVRILGGAAVTGEPAATSRAPMLSLAGPNPARGRTALRLAPTAPGSVRVAVYDALGRAVTVLHDGAVAGAMDLSVDTSTLTPGVYVVRADGAGAASALALTIVR